MREQLVVVGRSARRIGHACAPLLSISRDLVEPALVAAALERCVEPDARGSPRRARRRRCGRPSTARWRRCAAATGERCRGRCTGPRGRRAPCWRRSARPGRCPPSTMPRSASPLDHRPADRRADRRVVDRLVAVGAEVDHLVAQSRRSTSTRCCFRPKPGVVRSDRDLHARCSAGREPADRQRSRARSSQRRRSRPRMPRSTLVDRPIGSAMSSVVGLAEQRRRACGSARAACSHAVDGLVVAASADGLARRTSSLSVKRRGQRCRRRAATASRTCMRGPSR